MVTECSGRSYYRLFQEGSPGPVARRYARTLLFSSRGSDSEISGGQRFMPRFDHDGLLHCVVQHADSGAVLFCATMNREALSLTIRSGIAHFWAADDRRLWHRCGPAGCPLRAVTILVDQDQQSLLLRVWGEAPVPAQFVRQIDLLPPPRDLAVALKPRAGAEPVNIKSIAGVRA
jgi:phosphoribosyl-AMP cyclohydrolase